MNRAKLLLLLALGLIFALAGAASAQEGTLRIQLDLQSSFEPSSAVGLLISPDKTIEKLDTKIEKGARGTYVISFDYLPSEAGTGTFASALALSANGDAAFAQVKALQGNELDLALANIPDCSNETNPGAAIAGQMALLTQLVDIRSKLRTVAVNKLNATLSGDLLDKLRGLEKGFGLARDRELDPSMPALELIDRLSRILSSVQHWSKRVEAVVPEAPSTDTAQKPHDS
ncbi:MAG: hypothetical protein K1X79_11600 [Oligoflexia bacterium]|nr:hypothetical protein [Oligoflexia bacterium]